MAGKKKRICMKIDFISQKREIVLFLPSNMALMQTLFYCEPCMANQRQIVFSHSPPKPASFYNLLLSSPFSILSSSSMESS